MKIATLGSALQDIFLIDKSDFVPMSCSNRPVFGKVVYGSKVNIDRISYEIGGGGTNSAVAFARFGFDVSFLGNISRDAAGEAVLSLLDKEGVDTSYINFEKTGHTGCSVILLDAKTGERTILTHRGVSSTGTFRPESLLSLAPDYLYITSLSGNLEAIIDFIKAAKKTKTKIMFNPGTLELRRSDTLKKLLSKIDFLLLNHTEASMLVPGETLEELLSHLSNYTDTVLITDGSRGGIATDGTVTYRFGLYESVAVKDTTGAGDAFGAGFLAYLISGHSFRQSLIFASANSTSVVQQLGAKRGLLSPSTELHPMPIQKLA